MSAPGTIEVDAAPGVRAVFTTRTGGVSQGSWRGGNLATSTGDDPEHVRANRLALCEALGVDPAAVSMLRQVHGTKVIVLSEPSRPGRFTGDLSGWPPADALVTHGVGMPLMVLAADCVPVLLWRQDGRAVAAAHAGWRGMIDGVLRNAAEALGGQVAAAVGPCVGQTAYEVSEDLAERFSTHFGADVMDGRNLDLPACAAIALGEAGIAAGHIQSLGRCTATEENDFFSYRRDGAATGRQAAIIWRTDAGPANRGLAGPSVTL